MPVAPADLTDPPQRLELALLVEQYVYTGQTLRWACDEADRLTATREQGRRAALQLARTYRPAHPTMDQGRTIYRSDPDTLQVIVIGATANYRFRVLVVERLEQIIT